MNKYAQGAATSVILAAGFILLAGFAAPQPSFAIHEGVPDEEGDSFLSKVRAIQDGIVVRTNDDVEGIVGLPVDCVGGIELIAKADMMKCYLLSDNEQWAKDYKTDPTAIVQEGSPVACPEDAGFESDKQCFLTTFDASSFDAQGRYRFVVEFYQGDTLLDIVTHDYRLVAFFALPESAMGAIALVGSSLAVFAGYAVLAHRKPETKAA